MNVTDEAIALAYDGEVAEVQRLVKQAPEKLATLSSSLRLTKLPDKNVLFRGLAGFRLPMKSEGVLD